MGVYSVGCLVDTLATRFSALGSLKGMVLYSSFHEETSPSCDGPRDMGEGDTPLTRPS